jgi:hypothetical protein
MYSGRLLLVWASQSLMLQYEQSEGISTGRKYSGSCCWCGRVKAACYSTNSLKAFQLGESTVVDCVWNVMAHAQKQDFVFRRNGRVHLNRRGRQFIRLLATELCALAVVMLDTPSSEVVWRVLATHSIRHFPLHFPSRASSCAITFQLDSTSVTRVPGWSGQFWSKYSPVITTEIFTVDWFVYLYCFVSYLFSCAGFTIGKCAVEPAREWIPIECDVHGSVHRRYISKYNQPDATLNNLFFHRNK